MDKKSQGNDSENRVQVTIDEHAHTHAVDVHTSEIDSDCTFIMLYQ